MMKFAASLVLVAALAAKSVYADIPVGGLCAGIAGPLPTPCVYGSICCPVGPDRSLCAAVSTCPSQFVPVGGLCSGIAGPSPFPCFPGTTCCTLSPDNAVCKVSC
ncbi:hypothetical protein BDN70DRAFT_875240 [Pholiota conissans]|uniref:Uncharacterized protein n=1 Tax=Pholiota conissans TaxID=109636 RepID=A0A9P5Z7B4_9AGAR|nr:hypothetical protein BDN70DRAFT_875240 [Pholiota conissans]